MDGIGGKHLTLYGLGKTATATINNCEMGVYAYSLQPLTEVWISDCNMREVMNGVELNERGTGNFTQANIKDNYVGCTKFLTSIKTFSTGIEIKDPSIAYSYFNIDNNDIDLDQPEGYSPVFNPTVLPTGIQVTTTNNTTMSGVMVLDITANTIHSIKGQYGIFCTNTENTTISTNHVSNDLIMTVSTHPLVGIIVHGGVSNTITCNVVTQNNSPSLSSGILGWESPDVVISENSLVDLVGHIFMADDNGTNCSISYNDFAIDPLSPGNGLGIYYSNALTGPQYLKGNDWAGDFLNGAYYSTGSGTFTYCMSLYHVSLGANVDNSTNPIYQGPLLSCGDWFTVLEEDEEDFICGDDHNEQRAFSKNEADLNLAEGGSEQLSPGYRWTAELGLYQKFTEHSDLVEGDETIIAFLEAQAGGPVAQMYDTRQGINAVTLIGASLADDIENIVTQLRENETASLSLLDQLATDPNVAPELATLSALSGEFEAQLVEYLNAANSEAASAAVEASTNNSLIDCNSLPCILERYINGLYLETQFINPRNLNIDELEQVRDIALQCSAEAGAAPRLAQAWYYLLTGERINNNCLSFVPEVIGERQAKSRPADISQDLYLQPNPAGSSVTIYTSPHLQGGICTIENLWGKVIFQEKILSETMIRSAG